MIHTRIHEQILEDHEIDQYLSQDKTAYLAQEIAEHQKPSLSILKKYRHRLYYSKNLASLLLEHNDRHDYLFHSYKGKKIKSIVLKKTKMKDFYPRTSLFYNLQECVSQDFWNTYYHKLDTIDFILYPKMVHSLKKILLSYKKRRREILLLSSFKNLRELLLLWNKLPECSLPKKPKSFQDIYEKLLMAMRTDGLSNFKFSVNYESHFGPYFLKSPKDYYELVSWGVQFNNCVATMSHYHQRGDCMILGVFKNDKLKYLVKMQDKKIIEFVSSSSKSVRHPELEWWLSYGTDYISV